MLYLILLVIFLIQFLVALGALMFVIFLARPEVSLLGAWSEIDFAAPRINNLVTSDRLP
jgi:flagellar basal body-associated protein FliL